MPPGAGNGAAGQGAATLAEGPPGGKLFQKSRRLVQMYPEGYFFDRVIAYLSD